MDQCQEMEIALASKWSETYHRLCICHIYQNAAIHLSNTFANFYDFLKDFSDCIHGYDEEDDFIQMHGILYIKSMILKMMIG